MQEKNRNEDMSSDNRWKSSQSSSRAGSSVAAAIDEGSTVFDSLKDSSSNVAGKAKEIATNLKDKAQEYGGIAVDETSSFIKRYPAQSLLVGFGAGLAIGLLVARR